MKRYFRVALLLSAAILTSFSVWAEESSDSPEMPAAPVAETQIAPKPVEPPSPAELAKIKERQKKIEKKREALEATQWTVNLVSNDPKSRPETDTFTFINGQFKTENRSKRGFAPTNYTVTIPEGDDPTATFETMQSGKEGRAFIKGTWKDGLMEGRITEQSEDTKTSVDYFFTNAKMAKMDEETKKSELEKIKPPTSTENEKSLVSMEAPVTDAVEPAPKSKGKLRTR